MKPSILWIKIALINLLFLQIYSYLHKSNEPFSSYETSINNESFILLSDHYTKFQTSGLKVHLAYKPSASVSNQNQILFRQIISNTSSSQTGQFQILDYLYSMVTEQDQITAYQHSPQLNCLTLTYLKSNTSGRYAISRTFNYVQTSGRVTPHSPKSIVNFTNYISIAQDVTYLFSDDCKGLFSDISLRALTINSATPKYDFYRNVNNLTSTYVRLANYPQSLQPYLGNKQAFKSISNADFNTLIYFANLSVNYTYVNLIAFQIIDPQSSLDSVTYNVLINQSIYSNKGLYKQYSIKKSFKSESSIFILSQNTGIKGDFFLTIFYRSSLDESFQNIYQYFSDNNTQWLWNVTDIDLFWNQNENNLVMQVKRVENRNLQNISVVSYYGFKINHELLNVDIYTLPQFTSQLSHEKIVYKTTLYNVYVLLIRYFHGYYSAENYFQLFLYKVQNLTPMLFYTKKYQVGRKQLLQTNVFALYYYQTTYLYPNSEDKLKINHYYRKQNYSSFNLKTNSTYFCEYQEISLEDLAIDYIKIAELQYPLKSIKNIRFAKIPQKNCLRWFYYKLQWDLKVKLVVGQFNLLTNKIQQYNWKFNEALLLNFTIVSISEALDFILFKTSSSNMLYMVELRLSNTSWKYSPLITFTNQIYSLVLGSKGLGYKINNLAYLRDSTLNTFGQQVWGSTWNSRFNSEFAFFIQSGALYQINGLEKQYLLNVEVYDQVKIYNDRSKKKLVIFSYYETDNNIIKFKIDIFYIKNNSEWAKLESNKPNNLTANITIFKAQPQISQSFQSLVFYYIPQNSTDNKGQFIILAMDYLNQKIISLDVPIEITNYPYYSYLQISENYLYFKGKAMINFESFYQEAVFKYFPDTYEYKLLSKNQLTQQFHQSVLQVIITQGQKLFLTYAIQRKVSTLRPANNTIIFFRKYLNNYQNQILLNQIQPTNTGYFDKNQEISSCTAGCISCFNESVCFKCSDGYSMSHPAQVCLKCKGSCKSCLSSNLNFCISCFPGDYYSNGYCLKCDHSCLQCQIQSLNCTSCAMGFGLVNHQCNYCPQKCDVCINSVCTFCKSGYILDISDYSCLQCPLGCSICDSQKIFLCKSCIAGYQLVISQGPSFCRPCTSNCIVCSNGKCLKCMEGFKINSGVCFQKCMYPCRQCKQNDPFNCTSCFSNYNLINGNCSLNILCEAFGPCLDCSIDYLYEYSYCSRCKAKQNNCTSCSFSNNTQCNSCDLGYSLNDNYLCSKCQQNCLDCLHYDVCKKCVPGYTLIQGLTLSRCISCQAPCLTCMGSPGNCKSCIDGYTLKGWKCISLNYVQLLIKFKQNIQNISRLKFVQLQTQIMNLIGKNISLFNSDLPNNGTILEGYIQANKSSQASQMISILQQVYKNGTILQNLMIQQCSFLNSALQNSFEVSIISSGPNERIFQRNKQLDIFIFKKVEDTSTFKRIYYDPSIQIQTLILELNSSAQIVTISTFEQLSCALVHDTESKTLMLYKFTNQVQLSEFELQITSLVKTSIQNTRFILSSDCSKVLINQKLYSFDQQINDTGIYEGEDEYNISDSETNQTQMQFNLTLLNSSWTQPTFDESFTASINGNSIYLFNDSLNQFKLIRQDIFYEQRKIFKNEKILIVFSFELKKTVYRYKIQINLIQAQNPNSTTLTLVRIDQIVGQSLQQPQLQINTQLTILIIHGYDKTNIKFNIGRYINADQKKSQLIQFGPQFYSVKKYYHLINNFLYLKDLTFTKQGLKYEKCYIYKKNKFIQSFSKASSLLFEHNWIKTLIKSFDQLNLRATLVNVYKNYNQYTLSSYQAILTLPESSTNSFKKIQIPINSLGSLISSSKNFKWMYTVGLGPTIVFGKMFDLVTFSETVQLSLSEGNTLQILAVTPVNQDCAIIQSVNKSIHIVNFNYNSKTVKVIDDIYNYISKKSNLNTTSFQVTQSCNSFIINNVTLYKLNRSAKVSPFYIKVNQTKTSFQNSTQYDSTFTFAVQGNIIYKFDGNSNYVRIYQSLLYNTNKIFSNSKQNKLIIFSYQQGFTVDYKFMIKIFKQSGSMWKQILPNQNGTAYFKVPEIQISSDFESFLVKYVAYKGLNDQQTFLTMLRYIDFSFQKSYLIQVPQQVTSLNQIPYLSLTNNYFYYKKIRAGNDATSICQQIIYQIDKQSHVLKQYFRRQLNDIQIQYWKEPFAFEKINSKIILVYQVASNDSSTMTFSFIIRDIQAEIQQSKIITIKESQSQYFYRDNKIFTCSIGCSDCISQAVCRNCSDRFSLKYQFAACFKCKGYCKHCLVQNLALCTSCIFGYYLKNQSCIECPSECNQCQANNKLGAVCSNCIVGKYLNKAKQCENCSSNCDLCINKTSCTSCRLGYVVLNGSCAKCLQSCSYCSPTFLDQCLACRTGFQLVGPSGRGHCIPCSNHCQICKLGYCQQCELGYRNIEGQCAALCKFPCRQCRKQDPNACVSCFGDYILNEQKCQPDASCNQNQNCTSCPFGYFILQNICNQCETSLNCRTCNVANISQCLSCNDGFYLSQFGFCQSCLNDCDICESKSICSKCKQGYTISGNLTKSRCIKCQYPCLACRQSSINCLKCAKDYQMIGWGCVSKNKVNAILRLNTQFNLFTTSFYQLIQKQIMLKCLKKSTQIHLVSITSGSVIINFNIDATNSSQLKQASELFLSNFYKGIRIGGFEIISTQVLNINQINESPDELLTIYIIIGATAGGALIIILIVVLILYKLQIICKKKGPNLERAQREKKAKNIYMKAKIRQFEEKLQYFSTLIPDSPLIQTLQAKIKEQLMQFLQVYAYDLGQKQYDQLDKKLEKALRRMKKLKIQAQAGQKYQVPELIHLQSNQSELLQGGIKPKKSKKKKAKNELSENASLLSQSGDENIKGQKKIKPPKKKVKFQGIIRNDSQRRMKK